MPIWLELVLTMLFAYAAGLALGWGLWRRDPVAVVEPEAGSKSKGDAVS